MAENLKELSTDELLKKLVELQPQFPNGELNALQVLEDLKTMSDKKKDDATPPVAPSDKPDEGDDTPVVKALKGLADVVKDMYGSHKSIHKMVKAVHSVVCDDALDDDDDEDKEEEEDEEEDESPVEKEDEEGDDDDEEEDKPKKRFSRRKSSRRKKTTPTMKKLLAALKALQADQKALEEKVFYHTGR